MAAYEYRVVPFIGQIKRGVFSTENARTVSQQLQNMINKGAQQGWEFYRIDKVGIHASAGCLASLLGAKDTFLDFDQVVFRRVTTKTE